MLGLSSEYVPLIVNLTSSQENISLQETQYMLQILTSSQANVSVQGTQYILQIHEMRLEQHNVAANLHGNISANITIKMNNI